MAKHWMSEEEQRRGLDKLSEEDLAARTRSLEESSQSPFYKASSSSPPEEPVARTSTLPEVDVEWVEESQKAEDPVGLLREIVDLLEKLPEKIVDELTSD